MTDESGGGADEINDQLAFLKGKNRLETDPLYVVNGDSYIQTTQDSFALFPSHKSGGASNHKKHLKKSDKKETDYDVVRGGSEDHLMQVRAGAGDGNENIGKFMYVVKR